MFAKTLLAIAWRNLWRNRRRTWLTLSSIAFGFFFAVLMTGIADATYGGMIDLAARMGAGHVALQHGEFQQAPGFKHSLQGAGALQTLARQDADVQRAVKRIRGNLMLASPARNAGAGFIAFDPTAEDSSTLSLLDAVVEGEFFHNDGRPGIVIGTGLAQSLKVRPGNKLVLTLTDKRGEIVQQAVKVTGLLQTGAPTADGALALLPLSLLQQSLGYAADETGQVALFLGDQRRAQTVARRIGARLQPNESVAALAWQQQNPELAAYIASEIAGALVFQILIGVLVAAGIFNTLFMSVMERLREFGVLMALGFSPRRLAGMVLCESFFLALLGLLLGCAVTAGPYALLNRTGIPLSGVDMQNAEVAGIGMGDALRVAIYPEHLLWIFAAIVAAVMCAGLYPAWRAGRVDPAAAIRGE